MMMTLVARAIERVGDNAVGVGEQVIFVETGLFREYPTDEDGDEPRVKRLALHRAACEQVVKRGGASGQPPAAAPRLPSQ